MSKEYSGFRIAAQTNTSATIEIFGIIGDPYSYDEENKNNTLAKLHSELNKLKELKVSQIDVLINSPGGDVNDALAIYDYLKDHPATVTTYINGMCASAATIIFCAGTNRKISKNALFLIHKCSSIIWGNENELKAELESQRKVNDRLVDIYVENSTTSKEDIIELMNVNNGSGKWINATEVKNMGFAEVYNETKKVALSVDKKYFAQANLPELPEEYKNSEGEQKTILQELKDLKNTIVEFFTPKSQNNQNQEVTMKKFNAVFPIIFAMLAFSNNEEQYDEGKGRNFSDEELKNLEAKLQEFKNLQEEKKTWDAKEADLNKKVEDLTTDRDKFKNLYDGSSAFAGQANGDDANNEDSYAAKQKQNPMYARLQEEFDVK